MDNQLYLLIILHFAVKQKDDTQSSDDSFLFTGLTQNKISQYLNKKCAMPRASRIALAQHIKKSLGISGHTYKWLDSLDIDVLNNEYVKNLISYIKENKKLKVSRGRTEAMAERLLQVYNELLN